MEFVAMIYQGTTPLPGSEAWDALPGEEQQSIYADYAALNRAEGVTSGPPLGLPQDARTVRVLDGAIDTTEGPYLGVEGAVGGFMVIEAEDLDAAIAQASRVPAARHGGAIEVRPVAKYW